LRKLEAHRIEGVNAHGILIFSTSFFENHFKTLEEKNLLE